MSGSGQYLAGPYLTLQHTLAVMSLLEKKRKKLREPGKPSMWPGSCGLLKLFILHAFACERYGIQVDDAWYGSQLGCGYLCPSRFGIGLGIPDP